MEEIEGMKFGGTDPWMAKTTEAFGGVPVVLMEGEIYTGLERGMLEARWQEYHGLMVWRTMEVTKYRTDNIRMGTHANVIIMNIEKFNSLPPDVQKVIDETTGFGRSKASGDIWANLDAQTKQIILDFDKEAGNPPPYSLPDKERARWVERAVTVHDIWLEEMESKGLGEEAKALMADTKKWVEEYSK